MSKQATNTASNTNKLRKFETGETVTRERTVVGEGRVKASFTIGNRTDSYVVDGCVFDFSGCTSEEIMLLAMRGSVIAVQNRARELLRSNLDEAIDASRWTSIDVKRDVVDTERKSASPVEKAAKVASKLSDAERAELLAMLTASDEQ